MTLSVADLRKLPTPSLVQKLDYKAVLASKKATLNKLQPLLFDDQTQPLIRPAELINDETGLYWRVPALANEMNVFWLDLSSEPLVKQLEISTYEDLLLLNHINHISTKKLLAFQKGEELDHTAAGLGLKRLNNEDDDSFIGRILLEIKNKKPGTLDYYEAKAREISSDIRDIRVKAVYGHDAVIVITIMQNNETGQATDALIKTIKDHVTQAPVKLNNDIVDVQSAELVPINLSVGIKKELGALPDLLKTAQDNFLAAFEEKKGIGVGFAKNWIESKHFLAGVADIVLNIQENIAINESQTAYLASYSVYEIEEGS